MSTTTKVIIAIIAILVIMFGPNLFRAIMMPSISNKITKMLMQSDFEQFDQYIDSTLVKLVLHPFNRDYLKLNAAFLQKNKKLIDQRVDVLNSRGLNDKQKEEVYRNVFAYYVTNGNKERAKECVRRLQTIKKNKKVGQQAELIYKVQLEKSYEGLEELVEREKTVGGEEKMFCCNVIAMMYKNKGDNQKSDEYQQKLEELTNGGKEKC